MDRRFGFDLCNSLLLPLSMAMAQGGPAFAAPRVLVTPCSVGADVAVADLNDDGVTDLLQANPGPAVGPNRVTFRAWLLQADGSALGDVGAAPPAGPAALACTARVAAGDFDADGDADLVSVTYGLGVNFVRNGGQSRSVPGFAPAALVDDLGRHFACSWPVVLDLPVFLVEDFDGDGRLDVLLAPVLVDYWAQNITSPGLFLYCGRGDGTFEPVIRAPLPSAPVDADWVDWNGDGVAETLVVLGQNVPNALSNQPDVSRFCLTGRMLHQAGTTQPLPASLYVTSLAWVARQPGMANRGAYFIAAHTIPFPWIMQPELCVADVDAQGAVGNVTTIALPASLTNGTIGDLQGLQVADFDGDGAHDLVAVHAAGPNTPGSLLWVMGPVDGFGSHGGTFVTGLGGAMAESRNAPPASQAGAPPVWVPNLSRPAMIAITDLDLDQMPDVLVGGLLVPVGAGSRHAAAALSNAARPSGGPPRGRVVHVSPARPSPAGNSARCGTRGGLPVLGNAAFGVTLTDAPRDAVVGLVGGVTRAVFTWRGVLPMAHVPDHFGMLRLVRAGAEGAGRAAQDVPIPSNVALLGSQTCLQWMIHDRNANDPFPIYCSDTMVVELGLRR